MSTGLLDGRRALVFGIANDRRAGPDARGEWDRGLQADVRRLPRRDALRSNITIDDVAGVGVWLASDLSRQVAGETIHADGGFNILGVPTVEG